MITEELRNIVAAAGLTPEASATDQVLQALQAMFVTSSSVVSLGVGQTWQALTASRALDTTYTNTTGKPIMISVEAVATGPQNLFFVIGGVRMRSVGAWQAGVTVGATMIVPPGATYLVESAGWSGFNWFELR